MGKFENSLHPISYGCYIFARPIRLWLQFIFFILQLTIVDTVGYGDQINKEDSYQAVVDYTDAQFEAYLQEELKIKRNLASYHDSRIHICLYFICPTGHG